MFISIQLERGVREDVEGSSWYEDFKKEYPKFH